MFIFFRYIKNKLLLSLKISNSALDVLYLKIKMIIKVLRRFRRILTERFLFAKRIHLKLRKVKSLRKWVKNGMKKSPPASFKQKTVRAYAKKYKINTLIETGTYVGKMIIANRKIFKKIFSIELDYNLFKLSKQKCVKYHNISIFYGNSIDILPKLLLKIDSPCVFWLDAHYSGIGTAKGELDTPIMTELQYILDSKNYEHIILIDDACFFIGKDGYPTIKKLKEFVNSKREDYSFIVKYDIIRIKKKSNIK